MSPTLLPVVLPDIPPLPCPEKRRRPTKASEIGGNAPDDVKELLITSISRHLKTKTPRHFAMDLVYDLILSEISIRPVPEDPLSEEARVVVQVVVDERMLDMDGKAHKGFLSFLIDYLSSLGGSALRSQFMQDDWMWVSHNLAIFFQTPPHLGDELRVVNTCVWSRRHDTLITIKCEIYNDTRHTMAASALHNMMKPAFLFKL